MSRHALRQPVAAPTSRQRALVLLVLVNTGSQALHPVHELFPRLGGLVPLHTMWDVLALALHDGWAEPVGTRDPRAGFRLTPTGRGHAVRAIEAEATRELRAHEYPLSIDTARLGLKLPYYDLYTPPPRAVPNGHSGGGTDGEGRG